MDYYFEVITTYDKETVKHYTTYHYRHVDRRMPVGLILLGVFFLILMLSLVVEGERVLPYLSLFVGTIAAAVGVMMLTGHATIKVPDQVNGQPLQNRLRFFEDRVEYAGPQSQGFYRYDQVTRVGEDTWYFFLYVSGNQALIIPKNGFTAGDPESFRQLLLTKVPPRQG